MSEPLPRALEKAFEDLEELVLNVHDSEQVTQMAEVAEDALILIRSELQRLFDLVDSSPPEGLKELPPDYWEAAQ